MMKKCALYVHGRGGTATEAAHYRPLFPDCDVRAHSLRRSVPTEILYGSGDFLTSKETVTAFARAHHAGLAVMENGEYRVHTAEQTAFLDDWLRRCT